MSLDEVISDDLADALGGPVRDYGKGELVFAPSERPRSVYLLLRGSVRLYRLSEDGCELSIGYVAPGEVFGEVAALSERPREDFAEAVSPSAVSTIEVSRVRAVLAARPACAFEIAKQIQTRLQRIETRVEDMVFRDARARIARALLELADEFGRLQGAGLTIDLPLTQAALATLAGTTRQTVNASMRSFEREGLTARDRRRIVLLDGEQLRRAASGSR